MNRRTFMKGAPFAVVAIPASSSAKAAKPMRNAITRRQVEALRREIAYAAGRGFRKITDIAGIERDIAEALDVKALAAIPSERFNEALQEVRFHYDGTAEEARETYLVGLREQARVLEEERRRKEYDRKQREIYGDEAWEAFKKARLPDARMRELLSNAEWLPMSQEQKLGLC